MQKNILMIGLQRNIIKELEFDDSLNLYVIEEKELYENNKVGEYHSPILRDVFISEYIQSEKCLELAKNLAQKIMFCAVIPGRDYAVRATALIAEMLGLPGLGIKAAYHLTDKIFLRQLCKENSIPHPRFQEIKNKDELKLFLNNKSVIFKPANRQASLGVTRINNYFDIEKAWEYTTNAKEDGSRIATTRNLNFRFIAEDFIDGFEVSIETLVYECNPVFHNITAKTSLEDNFVEIQHIVPANIDKTIQSKLYLQKEKLVKSLGVKNGILHSEWKIENDNPHLIECAGRTPGGFICLLVNYSYEFNIYHELLKILCGEKPSVSKNPKKVSAIRYFNPTPGTLKQITGLDVLNSDRVKKFEITIKPGDLIKPINSSWDRIGYFQIVSDSYNRLQNNLDYINNQIVFIV